MTATVDGIMKAMSSAQQSEVKAWEEEILPCEHTLTLVQEPLIQPGNSKLTVTGLSLEQGADAVKSRHNARHVT